VSRIARRAAVLAVLAAVLVVAGATGAAAHPLGNFTVNTSSGLRVGPERLAVDYLVDMAEIPAFQARQAIDTDHDDRVATPEAAAWRTRECPRLAAGLHTTLDGRPVPLTVTGSTLTFPEGVGGLQTLRLECALTAPLPAGSVPGRSPATPPPAGGAKARTLTFTDTNHEGRVGWREVTAVGDRATLESADVPTTSASARLTAYPADELGSPLDQRTATLRFHAGGPAAAGAGAGAAREHPASRCEAPRRGSVANRDERCSRSSTAPAAPRGGVDRATAAFTALVGERSRSPGFALVALLLAVALGAAHALAPGHGKTVMAAYLVGLRGTPRQAATIGATITCTHTAGVLVLGLVLTTSRAVASERVYPFLGLGSGLLLTAVGVGLLLRARTGHHHPHPHDHGHQHPHDHGTASGARPPSSRGLVALGLAGGLVPSPSALVVLVGGITLGQVWFGVALVLAYGLGMAAALTGVGLLLAQLRTRVDRRLRLPGGSHLSRLGRLLPVATASLIVLIGVGLAAQGAARL
jgi:nickel/cobalt exporter